MNRLVAAHMTAQAGLRAFAATGVAQAWARLDEHDNQHAPGFLAVAVPLVLAAQRQAVIATDAFLARLLRRAPLGIPAGSVIGAAARGGVPLEIVYARPFAVVATALASGAARADAIGQGLARATSAAQTDVQLAMRATLRDVGERDPRIRGYQRVTNPGACALCVAASSQRYHTGELMPIHNHCGCGVDVITDGDVPDAPATLEHDGVTAAVREHGELGPVLADAAHHFSHT